MSSDGNNAQQWQRTENLSGSRREEILRLQRPLNAAVDIGSAVPWETDGHGRRVQEYVRVLATALSRIPKFAGVVTEPYLARLEKVALLHDLGKSAIPAAILNKPAPLTSAELEIMKTHCWIGYDLLLGAESSFKDLQEPLSRHREDQWWVTAKEVALSHHERWNGSGYPQGLAGESIPLSARLVALADVFDAATSPRVYKAPITTEEAAELLVTSSGTSFDPDVVEAFLLVRDQFDTIAEASLRVPADGFRYGPSDHLYWHFDHPAAASFQ